LNHPVHLEYIAHVNLAVYAQKPQITGGKKQSDEERGAALFAVRVHILLVKE